MVDWQYVRVLETVRGRVRELMTCIPLPRLAGHPTVGVLSASHAAMDGNLEDGNNHQLAAE